ncbi:Retrovirus-related Pol polyprotein [Stylophora pistillata]|uniref:Retrovirus-related Pol polyprotein n=1 Tax=Stylophora pistillata TaxID=50429 RepID=A0A2B4R757_STYPI|nr:Retrovirus-related Pol polyprotein [Stylophora pistillata]
MRAKFADGEGRGVRGRSMQSGTELKKNLEVKAQIEGLAEEIKSLKSQLGNKDGDESTSAATQAERDQRSPTKELADFQSVQTRTEAELRRLSARLAQVSAKVDEVGKLIKAIDAIEEYSFQYNINIIGVPELNSYEKAEATSKLCAKLFAEMGTNITLQDIDIAHRVPLRSAGNLPKQIICNFYKETSKGGEELPTGILPQGGGQIVTVSRSPPGDQAPVIRISSIQPNVVLLDCKIKGVPVSAVVDCGSPICILNKEAFKHIGLSDTLGKVTSKVVGAEGSQLSILGTLELDTNLEGIRAKQLFYVCDNLKQNALLGMDFLQSNGNRRQMNYNAVSVEAELSWDAVEEIKKLFPIDNDQLTEDQRLSVWKILAKHSKAVSRGPHDIGHCTKARLRVNTVSDTPSRLPLRRFSPEQEKYINKETQRLLEGDVIEPSTSPWSAQVVLASKKDGSYRYCVDFRRLNSATVKEHYPIPKIASLLTGMTWKELLAFFDDFLLFSPTFAKHCESLDRALSLIEEAGLRVKPEKCRILPKRAPFVGHILSEQGVSADPEKVSALMSWPPPTTVSELSVFLGKQFVARLDHKSLVWLQSFKHPKPQEAPWVEYLQQFDMKIEHRLGRLHANADGLSRRPWPEDPLVDKLEETNVASVPLIVETTTHVDESTPPEGMQSEPRQTPVPWSNEHFRTEQSKDKHLRAVRQWLEAGRRPPKQEMEGANRHMWSLWSQYNRLLLKDELLYRRWFDEKTGRENLQLNGPVPRPRAPMKSIRTGYPLERIQIHILGPLPETNKGNKFVAVVVDMYTKWPEAYALPDQEAETIAHAVMDNFICRFGCPRGVLSDQGRNFELRTFRGLCSLIESIKQRTTPYHPQCDGGAERLIRAVTDIIAKIAEEQKQWDQHLPKKQREILKEVQERVEKNVAGSHQKDVYDARCKRRSRPYKKGDLVWLEEKAVPRWLHWKFHRPCCGPWRVIKVVSDVAFRIQCQEVTPLRNRRKTRLIVHFNRLKPYHARPVELQPTMRDTEEVGDLSMDLNVGEHAVVRSQRAHNVEPAQTLRRSDRNRHAPVWMGDFLLEKDLDTTLLPLGEGVCTVARKRG